MSQRRALTTTIAGAALAVTALSAQPACLDGEDRLARWVDGWSKNRTGFHLREPNALLVRHADSSGWLPQKGETAAASAAASILVPLCGKSVDMPWLAGRGHVVVGVEGVAQAVREFAAENRATDGRLAPAPLASVTAGAFLPARRFDGARAGFYFGTGAFGTGYYRDDGEQQQQSSPAHQEQGSGGGGGPVVWAQPGRPLAFVQGDYFQLEAADMRALVSRLRGLVNDGGGDDAAAAAAATAAAKQQQQQQQQHGGSGGAFTHVWDRASLVAIQPSHREEYAAQTDALLQPGGRILLNTLEYEQARMAGPPFSVDAAEVRRLYEPLGYEVTDLERSTAADQGKFKFKVLDKLEERVFLLRKPGKPPPPPSR
jgi:hypothetical protein